MATDTTEAPEPSTEVNEDVQPQSTESQAAPAAPAFDPEKIDPQIKSHFEKTYSNKYKDYDEIKQAANQFAQVQNDPRYREWVQSINTPKKSEPFRLTEEEHTAMLGNPEKAAEIISRAAERVAQDKFAPQIEQLQREADLAKATAQLNDCIRRNPEFVELDQNGHIFPIMRQYPSLSYDDALAIAKQRTGWVKKAVALEAAANVENKKRSMTEKPGSSRATRGRKSFPSREDAMVYVMEQARLGNDVDEDDLDIS